MTPGIGQLDPTERLIVQAARVSLTNVQRETVATLVTGTADRDRFLALARSTHLAPLLSRSLSEWEGKGLPKGIIAELRKSYDAVLASNIRMYALFSELVTAWGDAGISVIPLKGILLAEKVYGDIGLRHLSDMDLLVREEDVEGCVKVANGKGWGVHDCVQHSEEFSREFGSAHPVKFIKSGVSVELHTHIHNRGKSYRVSIGDYWDRSVADTLSGCPVRALSRTDLVQHLCIHLYKHLFATELKVSSFCDIREVLAAGITGPEWDELKAHSLSYNAWTEVSTVLWLCGHFWECDIPPEMTADVDTGQQRVAEEKFLAYFRHGTLNTPAKLDTLLAGRVGMLAGQKGLRAKALFLKAYLFPTGEYLRQRYGKQGILPLLRVYHPFRLVLKGSVAVSLRMLRAARR